MSPEEQMWHDFRNPPRLYASVDKAIVEGIGNAFNRFENWLKNNSSSISPPNYGLQSPNLGSVDPGLERWQQFRNPSNINSRGDD